MRCTLAGIAHNTRVPNRTQAGAGCTGRVPNLGSLESTSNRGPATRDLGRHGYPGFSSRHSKVPSALASTRMIFPATAFLSADCELAPGRIEGIVQPD